MEKQGGAYYRYSYRELSAFCLQISLLLESAVPLDEGLAIMAEDAADKHGNHGPDDEIPVRVL